MKRHAVWLTLALASLLAPFWAQAHNTRQWKGAGGWDAQGEYGRLYDPNTVETVGGTVVRISTIAPIKRMSAGIEVSLRTEEETLRVHLGPRWYLDHQDVRVEVGDRIEIRGSRIAFRGKTTMIAAEIVKGGQVLRLRDENGHPIWSGWRKR